MSELLRFRSYRVRPASILTNSYVAGTVIENAQNFNTVSLNIAFTKGSLSDASVKIEVSNDGVNYYQLCSDSISNGVDTIKMLSYCLSADGNYSTTPLEINAKYIKVSAIGTSITTGSSMTIDVICSTN